MKPLFSMTFVAVLVFSFTSSFANIYYPNRKGDVFQYSSDFSSQTQTDRVVDSYLDRWKLHSAFGGFGERWVLTYPSNQKLYICNSYNQINLIADFCDPVGTEYIVMINPCNRGKSRIAEKNLTVTVPAGTFENVIRVDFFDLNCADAGVTSHYYAPGVGLIKWKYLTIAGPQYYEFTQGTVNGVSYPRKGIEVSAYTDKYTYYANLMPPVDPDAPAPKVYVELQVKNCTEEDIKITYNSSCKFDILVRDSDGNVVYRYLDHVNCLQVVLHTILKSGTSFTVGGYVPLEDNITGELLPQGNYTVEILTTGSVSWSASLPVTLQYVY